MREILFRGKDIKEHWHIGLLAHIGNAWYISNSAGIPTACEVIPSTIGEYTGLKDKNDKMIFEGDVVLLKSDEEPYQVAFDECCFQVYSHSVCYVMDNFYDHDIEVIGNIHDNPEMLEV